MHIDEKARKRELEIAANLEWEQKILRDIETRTGVRPRWLGSLDLDEAATHQIVPILVEWLNRGIPQRGIRGTLYGVLGRYRDVKHLLPHLLQWWANEDDELSVPSITSLVRHAASARSARLVWHVVKARDWSDCFANLYLKLGKMPAVRQEVIAAVVQVVKTEALSMEAVESLRRINHPEVTTLLAQKTGIGERTSSQRRRRPQWLQIAEEEHSTGALVFHGEVETSDLNSRLQTIAAEAGVEFPDFSAAIPFLASKPPSWFKRVIDVGSGAKFSVYFRAEDVDVAEVAVFQDDN